MATTQSIAIDGRPISNIRFADDIDLMDGSNGELQDLTNRNAQCENIEKDMVPGNSKAVYNTLKALT